MKTVFKPILKVLLIGLIGILAFAACEEKEEKKPVAYDEVLTSTSCDCESDWFPHSQTPAPEEGKGSPFDTTSTTNCMFQQWAWQKFLWLTKPEGNNPLFLDSLIQVTSHMQPVTQQSGATVVLTDTAQAGPGAILKTNPAFNSTGDQVTVFYSIHIDQTLQNAATTYLAQIASGTLPPNNTATFPIGSLEVKMAWVETSALPSSEVSNYFTTTAAYANGSGYENKEVALLGMHVVGVVINHPEFIWATFEHSSMAPVYDATNGTVSSSDQTLLFAQGSASNIDGIRWDGSTSQPRTADQAFALFKYGVPLDAGGGYMSTSQQEPENFNNIDGLNTCVAANLTDVWKNYFYNGAIWINTDGLTPTQQADTIVSLAGNIKHVTPGSIARGSTNCANLSMETFVQTFESSASKIDASNLVNCFTCHNANGFSSGTPVSPLYISHIFNAAVESEAGKSAEEIRQLKAIEFSNVVGTHKKE